MIVTSLRWEVGVYTRLSSVISPCERDLERDRAARVANCCVRSTPPLVEGSPGADLGITIGVLGVLGLDQIMVLLLLLLLLLVWERVPPSIDVSGSDC